MEAHDLVWSVPASSVPHQRRGDGEMVVWEMVIWEMVIWEMVI